MMHSWLSQTLRRALATSRRLANSGERKRPLLEVLEDRTLLTNESLGVRWGSFTLSDRSIAFNGEIDTYRFTTIGTATSSHGVSVSSPNGTNLDLELYNDDTGTFLRSSYSTTNGYDQLSFNGLSAGNYRLRVGSGSALYTWNYYYSVGFSLPFPNPDSFENNDSSSAANNLGTRQGGWTWSNLTIDAPYDDDWYAFTTAASANNTHYIQIEPVSGFGSLGIALFNASGTLLTFNEGTGNRGVLLTGLPPGTYFTRVYGGGNINPNYTLRLFAPTAPTQDAAEPNNTINAATNLGTRTGSSVLTGLTVHQANNDDWFVLQTVATGNSTDYFRLEHNAADGDLNLALYDAAGTLLTHSATGNNHEQINIGGLMAGVYYLQVYGLGHTNPNYSLRLQAPVAPAMDTAEPNNSIGAAINLGLLTGSNVYSNLTIHQPNNDDWFVLRTAGTGGSGDYFRVEHNAALGDLNLALYDASGYLLAYSATTNNHEQINIAGLPAGIYYLLVYGGGHTNPNYTLRVQAPAGLPADAFEAGGGNNTSATASNLGTISGTRSWPNLTIHAPSNDDWYRFTLGAAGVNGNRVRLDFNTALGDVDLELYSGNGTLIGYSIGSGNTEEVSLAGLPAGNYFIRVYGYNGSLSPGYTLSISGPAVAGPDTFEPNNTIGAAHNLGAVAGLQRWRDLSIHQPGDQDWFQFDITAGAGASHFVQLDFSTVLGDVDMLLFNNAGVLVGQSQGATDRERISLNGLPAGTYKLVVFGYQNAINPNYMLSINAPGSSTQGDRFEANNSASAATVLGPLRGIRREEQLSIHNGSDSDWFSFSTTATSESGHFVAITFQNSLGDLDLFLYGSDGTTVLRSSTGVRDSEVIELNGRAAGTYYVRVVGYNGANNPEYNLYFNLPGGDYAEAASSSGNNTPQTAFLLRGASGLKTWADLSIHTSSDVDWYRLELGAGAVTGHYAQIDFNNALGDLDLYLYGSDGTTLLASSRGVANSEIISLAGRAAGTYYLLVNGYNGATNPLYNLTVNVPVNLVGDWAEGESNNNTKDSATSLGTLQGLRIWADADRPLSIHSNSDVDWLRFELAASGVTGNAAAIFFRHTEGDLDLELYDGNGVLLERSRGVGDSHTVSLAGRPAGGYYLRIYGHNGATNPQYALVILAPEVPTSDWAESNNTRPSARDLGAIHGPRMISDLSIHQAGDRDWFQFTTSTNGRTGDAVGIVFNQAAGDLDLRLYNSAGQLLAAAEGVENLEQISLDGRAAGTYYVEVYGARANTTNARYALIFSAPEGTQGDWAESNNSQPNAYALRNVSGAQTWSGLSIHNASDQDWFSFTLTSNAVEGHFAAIGFDPRVGDLDLELYDNNGTRLASSATGQGIEWLSLAGLSANTTYFVRVLGYNGAVNPRYFLHMNAPATNLPADWAEPNDTQTAARDLQTVQGSQTWGNLSIHAANNEDWFKFRLNSAAVEGHQVAIDFDRSLGDLELRLYDSNGTEIAASTSISNRQQLSLAGRAAGQYFLRVRGVGSATNPNYWLTIQAPQSASGDWAEGSGGNNSQATAYDLREVPQGVLLSGLSIHSSSDEDWFRFVTTTVGVQGQVARIDFSHAEGNLTLELFNAGGTLLATSATSADFEEISLAGRPAGSYFVRIRGSVNPSYVLTITSAPVAAPDRLEPNDTRANAYDLRQVLRSGGSRTILSSILGSELHSLLYPNGTNFNTNFMSSLNTGFNGGLNSLLPGLSNQLGQMGINPNSYIPASSSLWNPLSTISINNPFINGSYFQYGGNSNLGVTPSQLSWALQGTGLQHLVSGGGGLSNPVVAGNLFGQQTNNNLFTLGLGGLAGTSSFSPLLGGLGLGGGYSNWNNIYQNTLSGLWGGGTDGMGNIAGIPLSYLFRAAERDSSGVQPVTSLTDLSLHNSTDNDWFRLDLPRAGQAGQVVRIDFTHALGDLDLELTDAAGTVLLRSTGRRNAEEISLAGLAAGTYYLRVYGEANPNYTLSFQVDSTPSLAGDWAEPNQTRPAARDLRRLEGRSVHTDLSIHHNTDQDWFAFTTAAAGQAGNFVRINFNSGLGDLDLALVDAAGNVLARSEGTGNFEEISLNGRAAGVYYLQIYGYQGATNPQYTLTIDAPVVTVNPDRLEPNNTATQATNLSTLSGISQVTALSIHPGDSDWLRFSTTGVGRNTHSVSIQFEHAAGDLQLELYTSSNTTTPVRFSRGSTGTELIPLEGLAAGTYFVRIYGNTGSTANRYDLQINAPTTTAAVTQDDWTIMVYMTASDLAAAAGQDINEMEEAARRLGHSVNIVVFWDQSNAAGLPRFATGGGSQAPWGSAGRAIIRPDNNPAVIATPFEILGEQNSGQAGTLTNFITWAAQVAPARRYALILWNHGDGIFGSNNDDADGAGDDRLYTPELVDALQQTQTTVPMEVVAFDACLMNMVEVAHSLRSLTRVVVGSQEVEHGFGHDYRTAFAALQNRPGDVTAEGLATSLVQSFQRQYQFDSLRWDTHAALDASRLNALTTALATFVNTLPSNPAAAEWNVLRAARQAATSFWRRPYYRDLGQFLLAAANGLTGAARTAALNAVTALNHAVISRTNDQRNVSGLSIYLPEPGTNVDSRYPTHFAGFLTASNWGSFLQRFLAGTGSGVRQVSWASGNNSAARSHDLRYLSGSGHQFPPQGLAVGEQAWFRFVIDSQTTATLRVAGVSSGRLRLSVYDAALNQVGVTEGDTTQNLVVSLSEAPTGEQAYYVLVESPTAEAVSEYTLQIDAPIAAGGPVDWSRGNDTARKARDLGLINGANLLSGLVLENATPDWFRFDTPRDETALPAVLHINLIGNQTVTAVLRDREGNFVSGASGTGQLHLEYLSGAARAYQLQITGVAGQTIRYQLHFVAQLENDRIMPLSDDFNRADSAYAGSLWTERFGDLSVVNNRLVGSADRESAATIDGVEASDVLLEASVDVTGTPRLFAGLLGRFSQSAPGRSSFYLGMLDNFSTGYFANIYKRVDNEWTLLGSVPASGGTGTLRFTVVGSQLTLSLNGQPLLSVEDTTLTTGRVGVWSLGGRFDNFSAIADDGIVPTIARVSSSAANGVYAEGAEIPVTVEFSEPVTLAGGNLTIQLSTGATVVITPFNNASSATGTYVVAAGHNSADLNSTALALASGATLRDAAGNNSALQIPSGQSLADLKNLVIDTTAPAIVRVTSSAANGVYGVGANIPVTVEFSEPVTLAGGNLTIQLSTGATVVITPFTNAGSATGTYVVAAGHNSADLNSTALALASGATLRDAAGNNSALQIPSGQSLADLKNLVIDTTAPAIVRVTSSAANGVYGVGANIPVTVEFSEPVTLAGGNLTIQLSTGATVVITPFTNAGSATGTYVVAAGHNSADLNSTALALASGATLRDAAGNNSALQIPSGQSLADLKDLVIDTTAPSIARVSSSAANGVYAEGAEIPVTVEFSEPVTLAGGNLTIQLSTGATVVITPFTNAGSATGTYVVAAGHNSADLNSTALALASGATLRDAAGNNSALQIPSGQSLADLKNLVIDTTAPAIVRVTSSAANGVYGVGANIPVTVEFSEPVTLAGGNLTIQLSTGATVVITPFNNASSATGTYVVAAGHNSADLNSTALALASGATLRDAAGNNSALQIPSGQSLADLKNLVIDTTAPAIVRVTSSAANGVYGVGANIPVTVEFSEPVTLAGGNLTIQLSTGATVVITPFNNAGSATGTYVVAAGHNSADLNSTALALASGATLRDAAGNNSALQIPSGQSLADLKNLVIDTTAPAIVRVTSSAANGVYGVGANIPVTVEFSEPVTLAGGNLTIQLSTGATVVITPFTNAGSATGTYVVAAGHNSADLNSTALALASGATLRDAAGNNSALQIPSGQSLADLKNLVIDTTAPAIVRVTSSAANGVYGVGANIPVTVEFSEPVTLAGGNLTIQLSTGATVVITPFNNAGSATGTYVVAAGHNSADLNSTALALASGATLRDAAGNNSALQIPSGQSLADLKNLVISTPPRIARITSSAADGAYRAGSVLPVTIEFSKPVRLVGELVLRLNSGGIVRIPAFGPATSVTANYTIASGHNSPDLNVTTLTLGTSSTLRDLDGNPVPLTVPANNNLADHKHLLVDTVAPRLLRVTSSAADGTYQLGAQIPITVEFSEPMTLQGGQLTIPLSTGGSVIINPFTGETSATGIYTVAVGQNSTDLNNASKLTLSPGASLLDVAGHTLSLVVPSTQQLARLKDLVIDTPAYVTQVRSTAVNGTYSPGRSIPITLTFSERVRLTGGPLRMALNSGGTVEFAPFGPASTVTGKYTVAAGQDSQDLNALALTLPPGAALRDLLGTAASLQVPTGSNLGDLKDLVIDSTAPAAPTLSNPTAAVTVDANSFVIRGTAEAGSLVRIYRDSNGDGNLTSADKLVALVRLAAGVSQFSLTVPLLQRNTNRFLVTATDPFGNISSPAVVAPIHEVESRLVEVTFVNQVSTVQVRHPVTRRLLFTRTFRDQVSVTQRDVNNDRINDIVVRTLSDNREFIYNGVNGSLLP